MRDMELISRLVGGVTEEQLRHVDYAVTEDMGLFMPVSGPCYYAISPKHTHPSYSFIYAFDNFSRLKIGDRIKLSIHGKICAISPEVVHQELHEPESEVSPRYIAVLISTQYFEKQLGYCGIDEKPCFHGDSYHAEVGLVNLMAEFLNEYESAAPGYQKILEGNGLKITHYLIRMIFRIKLKEHTYTHRISVNNVISFMHSHYGEKLTVADLAEVVSISPSHFARLFKQETGTAPMEYLHRIRLDMAKRMLRTCDASLTEIALKCGFNSSSYLSSCFSGKFKMTPSDFRKSFHKIGF